LAPPSPPISAKEFAARLNARFVNGQPSPSLSGAGVLIHQLDSTEEASRPWLPCSKLGLENWCANLADRWASSLINKDLRFLYYKKVGGFVLDPSTTEIFCAYSSDGDSQRKVCPTLGGDSQCIPGCYPPGHSCIDVGHEYECSFPPQNLQQALQAQLVRQARDQIHNELVVDQRSVTPNLPNSIEAMFYLSTSTTEELQRMRRVHTDFVREYPHADVVLLMLDLAAHSNPFKVDDGRTQGVANDVAAPHVDWANGAADDALPSIAGDPDDVWG